MAASLLVANENTCRQLYADEICEPRITHIFIAEQHRQPAAALMCLTM
jgi:hypothetical protein